MADILPPVMKCENFYVVRHGMRNGQLPQPLQHLKRPYVGALHDDPLSLLGQKQAEALSERAEEIAPNFIFSSPFRRAIETAIPLSRRTGIPIRLEWGLSEYLNPDWFGELMPELPNAVKRAREYPEVDPRYKPHVPTRFPETLEDMLERTRTTARVLTENYGPNIIVFGHGASTLGVRNGLLGIEHDPIFGFNGYYAALSLVRREAGKWKYVLGGDTSHLEIRGLYPG